MEPRETEIDGLLRTSMNTPVPDLPSDFEQRLMLEVNRRAQPLGRNARVLLAGYCLLSVLASTAVLRGQGLDWGATASMILLPLTLVAATPSLRRSARTE